MPELENSVFVNQKLTHKTSAPAILGSKRLNELQLNAVIEDAYENKKKTVNLKKDYICDFKNVFIFYSFLDENGEDAIVFFYNTV